MILFLGDTHGDKLIPDIDRSAQAQGIANIIQVGDFGIHWPGQPKGCRIYKYFEKRDRLNHPGPTWYTVGGNHDNYTKLQELRERGLTSPGLVHYTPRCHFVERGTILPIDGQNILFLGGAESSDCAPQGRHPGRIQYPGPWKAVRATSPVGSVPGAWWTEETVTDTDIAKALLSISEIAPDIVVTHDVPRRARPWRFEEASTPNGAIVGQTADKLEVVADATNAKYWFYGHHHTDLTTTLGTTTFYGCGIVHTGGYRTSSELQGRLFDGTRVRPWRLR